ncbi:RDD family protein [Flammeovirga yaeyamensis]|uniref:RDD family protein n=1 Tax=Flammeovirga yaeyamensis TaxID=367791 RepID=A0AAX1NFN5_9BACT|nr:RDD family protein [Flammeovirga yaeyamensis]MBB3696580.1 putative RDD family membrane protein YckC [Flammeovirga yaeyamensis]NMF33258.1 RDD family protein [Flammeovirga yaeyamensis]QWG05463.1 RDD family protein [Flammeovirga yaeyamensis]
MDYNRKVGFGERFVSMIIDHISMTFLLGMIAVPIQMSVMSEFFTSPGINSDPDQLFGSIKTLMIPYCFIYALYFCKDAFKGRSLGKLATNLQVYDNKTDEIASPIKCFVRNISIIIWPIEVIMVMINPNRRIGDYISGTYVDIYDKKANAKVDFPKIGISYVLSVLVMGICMSPLVLWLEYLGSIVNDKEVYVDTVVNEKVVYDELSYYFDSLEMNMDDQYIQLKVYASPNVYLNSINEVRGLVEPIMKEKFPYHKVDLDIIYTENGTQEELNIDFYTN